MASLLRPRVAWVIPAEIAVALATVAVIPLTTPWSTTYSGASPAAAVADLAAGIGLIAAGSARIVANLRAPVGWAAVLAGIAWLSADWAGWQGGPALPRTLAMALTVFYLPLILHLLALDQHEPVPWIMRRLVPLAYGFASLIALGWLLFRDPGLDLHCWSNCTDNVLLIGNLPLVAGVLEVALPAFELVAGSSIVLVGALFVTRGTFPQRRMAASVAIPALLVGAGGAAHGLALLADPHEGPRFAIHVVLFQLRAWAGALLAMGIGWTVVRAWRSRAAVMRLATDLGSPSVPGRITTALAAASDDPSLEVLFWLPRPGGYVDESGHSRQPPEADRQRSAVRVSHAGRLISVVTHDPSAIDVAGLDRLLGPAARLALENERLRAELLAKIEEVHASRSRIVDAGDAARAEMERNLHDGAQQGLLAVVYKLRVAADAAEASGDGEARDALQRARAEAETLLRELREIAHGIYPAILGDRGLAAAPCARSPTGRRSRSRSGPFRRSASAMSQSARGTRWSRAQWRPPHPMGPAR